ncbi:MAG: hypothetical protein GVY13_15395 [Alphaproteobacteria bacterium]|jgi:small ligand-binding sensory domain FIST|nr:hypothetical protein [Alphaproteobacteria bacterium]
MIKVGFDQSESVGRAVERVLKQALAGQPVESVGFGLCFAGGRHDPYAVLAALQQALPGVPIIGGAAVGCMGNSGLGYSGFELTLALFPKSLGAFSVCRTNGLDKSEFDSGCRLGRRIAEEVTGEPHVLLFYDCIAEPSGPSGLHPASWLLDGLYAGLGAVPVTISGAAMLSDFGLSGSWLFDGQGVATHSAVALVLPPAVQATTSIFHGCIPISGFYEITRIEGAALYELDGRPAASVIEEFIPPELFDDDFSLMLHATIGQNQGNRFSDYKETAFVNRLVLSADRSNGSLRLFDADFHEGAVVQIMLRDTNTVLESTRSGARRAADALCDSALLNLYFDCAGRASAVSGLPMEEAGIVQEIMEKKGPFCGFYSGVEIAPFFGRSRPLDWTGVLTALSARGP